MRYAAHEARLRLPAADGHSQREHLEGLAARGGRSATDAGMMLKGPDMPESLEYLWEVFQRLDAVREYGTHGPSRITDVAIDAAIRLNNWSLSAEEVTALIRLDVVTLFPPDEPDAN